ncbi:hypothetical protein SLA2020_245220 [Shorea laevis]
MGGGAWPFLVGGAICLIIAIVGLQRGIPSKRESSARVDYVPALCTHRPSLLPIEWSGEVFGSRRRGRFNSHRAAGRILCRRLKYATGYCKWQSGLAATIH